MSRSWSPVTLPLTLLFAPCARARCGPIALPAVPAVWSARVARHRLARNTGKSSCQQEDGLPDDRSSDLASERPPPHAPRVAPRVGCRAGVAVWAARPAGRCGRNSVDDRRAHPGHGADRAPAGRGTSGGGVGRLDRGDHRGSRARRADPDRDPGPGRRRRRLGAARRADFQRDHRRPRELRAIPSDRTGRIHPGVGPAVGPSRRRPERCPELPELAGDRRPGAGHRQGGGAGRRQRAGRVPPVGRIAEEPVAGHRLHDDPIQLAADRTSSPT